MYTPNQGLMPLYTHVLPRHFIGLNVSLAINVGFNNIIQLRT